MVVLVAEPHRVRRQALGRGIGGEGAGTVAHQAGGGRNPQIAGVVLEQIRDGIAFELRCVLRVEGNEIDAIEADQASVGAQPQKPSRVCRMEWTVFWGKPESVRQA